MSSDSVRRSTSRESSPLKRARTEGQQDVGYSPRISGVTETSTTTTDSTTDARSSMQFSEIRSLKRIHRAEEGISTDNVIDARGIVHPSTGKVLTVGEAIRLRILDVRNGRIATSSDAKTSVTIEEAARMNLIDGNLANHLLGPCGVTEDGRQISLLEAIQQELFDAERGDDRVKVTTSFSGVSVADAMSEGLLDPITGQVVTANGERISIEEAYSRGYLTKLDVTVKVKKNALALSDAISQGLVDDRSGRILDRVTGEYYLLNEAIEKGVIDPDVKEVVDARNDIKLTVAESIQQGILNPKSGRYMHGLSMERLSLKEARRRQLIVKPMTLKDCCDLEIIDETGRIASPAHRKKLTVLEAISRSVLDSENLKSITDTKAGEPITLSDALSKGVVKPEGTFKDTLKDEELSIQEAVDKGLVMSISQKTIFDIDGFKDPVSGEYISLNSALLKGLISPKSGGSYIVDLKTGKTVPLDVAEEQGFVRSTVSEMLNCGIGITEEGREISVLEAVLLELVDPKSGQLLDPRTKRIVPLEDAIKRGLITPDGAALLTSLLNIAVTTQTVTKTVKRYVTVLETGEVVNRDCKITYAEAIKHGLIDQTNKIFTDPDSGKIMSVHQAIEEGLLGKRMEETPAGKVHFPSKQVTFETTLVTNVGNVDSPDEREESQPMAIGTTTTIITKEIVPPSEDKLTQSATKPSVVSTTFIPSSSIQSTIKNGTISPIRTSPPSSPDNIDRSRSRSKSPSQHREEQKAMIDSNSFSTNKDSNETKIETQISVTTTRNHKSEISSFIESERTLTEKRVFELPTDGWTLADAINQKLFDPATGLFIIPGTDRLVSFEECIKLQIINPNSGAVIDPNNGRKVSLMRSLEKNILDSTGHYTYPQKISMKEAIERQLVILQYRSSDSDATNQRLLQITKVSGKPDKVELTHVDDPTKDTEIKVTDESSILDPVQVSRGLIYDPATALVISTDNGTSANLLKAVNDGTLQSKDVLVRDPSTGKNIAMPEAVERGILDSKTGEYKVDDDRKLSLLDATKFGLVAVVGAPLVAAAAAVEAVKKAMIKDPTTGEKIPREVAIERGLVPPEEISNVKSSSAITVTETLLEDLRTSTDVPVSDFKANESVSSSDVEPSRQENGENVEIKDMVITKSFTPEEDSTDTASLVAKARARVTTEPKYTVTIGKAKSFSQSPEREAKPIVLQKMKKRIVKASEAMESGLIDEKTVHVIETEISGDAEKKMTLSEAIESNRIDADSGKILDPQRGDVVSIKEALDRGILDPENADLLVPLAKSLSIPGLYKQGLLDPQEGKVIHPETGDHLTLNEAIVCGIVDPLSKIIQPNGQLDTLENAIANDVIDADRSLVKSEGGSINLVKAVEENVFENRERTKSFELPPAGMTFPVALKRGLIDPSKNEIRHPITGENVSLKDAIATDFIMTLPYPVAQDSIKITEALESGLIDKEKGVFVHPTTGTSIPIVEAVESGLLIIKTPEKDERISTITETVTSYHTITTKTIELLPGYVLLNATQVQNLETGDTLTIEEARDQGIIKDESEKKEEFTTKDIRITFSDAVEKGLVDMNAGTYTDPNTGAIMPISKAVEVGILDTSNQTNEPSTSVPTTQNSLTILEAIEQIYDDKTESFTDPESKKSYNLTEAIEVGLIEPDSVLYDVKTAETITTKEALEKGLLDPQTGKIKQKDGESSMSIAKAAKLGLLAVVAAPVLAGKAVVDAIQTRQTKKPSSPVESISAVESTSISAVTQSKVDTVEPTSISTVTQSKVDVVEPVLVSPVTQSKIDKTIESESKKLPDEVEGIPLDQESKLLSTPKASAKEILQKEEKEVCDSFIANEKSTAPIEEPQTTKIPDTIEIEDLDQQEREDLEDADEKSDEKLSQIVVSKDLSPRDLADRGLYNMENERFVDPTTDNIISFNEFVLDLQIFDPDNVWVKDLSKKSDKYVTLREAIDRPLVDRNVGYMVDPKSGKKIPFFEAVKLGWIEQRPSSVEKEPLTLSLQEAVEAGVCDPINAQIHDPKSGEPLSLSEAVEVGLIDADSLAIRNPISDEILPLSEALESGVIDLHKGVIINVETRTEIDIKVAFLKGMIVPRARKPISLEAAINNGIYEPNTGKIQDPLTKQFVDVEESVRRGIIDAFITECQDTKAGSFVSLDDALTINLLNSKMGRLQDTKAGELLPLDTALNRGLIITTPFVPSLIDVIAQEYYSPKTGLVLNPVNGAEMTIKEALTIGYIDDRTTMIKDDRRDKVVSVKEAAETLLLDLQCGLLNYPHSMTLDIAFEKGYLLSTTKPWTLQEALAHQTYDPKTGTFTIDGESYVLEEAIAKGIINQDSPSIKDPRNNDIISLGDAIKRGLINPKSGTAIDPSTGVPLSLTDALDRGLVVPAKRKISLPEAIFKGFYDPKTGHFIIPDTQEKLPTDRAIKKGVIDTTTAIVRHDSGDVITFTEAIEKLIVDPKTGTVATEKGRRLDFHEALERGLLLETRRPMSFSEAISKGILDDKTNTFLDPQTGTYLTILEAIQKHLIDADSVTVKDVRSPFLKTMPLMEAIELGYVDGNTGRVKDLNKGNVEMSLRDAYESGLIIDNKAAVSLQRAVHQGLYDDKSGKIIDPGTNRAVTLHEAMRKCIIGPTLPCYWDKRSERLLSLAETCRAGVIDRRSGMFKEPGANCTVTLSLALQHGLIVDIESMGFGLYEAILMDMYDSSSGKFIHPLNNKKLTLAEAIQIEMIDPLTSIVKNTKSNKYVLLAEAISDGIIDDIRGTYNISEIDKVMDLQEARKKGFIVTSKTPLSIEEAVKCGLYRGDSGKFAKPTVNEFYDLVQALSAELIDPDTTALKDATTGQIKSLQVGIDDGTIDVPKGRVLDPKTKRSYNIDVAFERGLLVTVEKPLTLQPQRSSLEGQKASPKESNTRECTVEEAIKYEFINPNVAVVRDPRNGRFIVLKKALDERIIDPSEKGTIEPQVGKLSSRCIRFGENTVFLLPPLSFEETLEKGHLSFETGKVTDPSSNEQITLKEAVTLGIIDPDSALIKDAQKKKLVRLPEAFRKGMMDPEKGNVLDTDTSKLYTLSKAVEIGLVMTPKQGFSFIEALEFGLYNPTTGSYHDPFLITSVLERKRLTLASAIEGGLIDPSTTVIKDPISGNIVSLLEAVNSGKVDSVAGRFFEDPEGKSIDFVKAMERGYILTAEARVSQRAFDAIHLFYFSFFFLLFFSLLIL